MKLVAGLSLAILMVLPACADETVQPGSILARWDLTPNDCTTARLSKIRARALRGTTQANEAEVACSTSGSVEIPVLPPGTYTVIVEGLNDDPTPRVTFEAKKTGVVVSEGGQATFEPVRPVEKPGRLHVRWIFDNGLLCVDNDTNEVKIEILDLNNKPLAEAATVPCDNTFTDPYDNDNEKSGYLFEEVDAEVAFNVLVTGYDKSKNIVQRGQANNLFLSAGGSDTVQVTLAPFTQP